MSFAEYIKETKGELKHVNWPTRNQTTNYTILVIIISVVVSILLFAFDTGVIALLSKLLFK
ncbi:MAG: preprotein translocase subunit SecE [Candidatus Vogelbacteria bacterium]|nr:preprotein translocase subunit SecE [Candidatus Vogelbacteria bacterium]